MSPVKEQLFGIIDYLSESKQALLLALAKEFLSDADDIATPDDLEAIRIAREEYDRGETIPFEDIDWGDD